jgi:hypothetical protein
MVVVISRCCLQSHANSMEIFTMVDAGLAGTRVCLCLHSHYKVATSDETVKNVTLRLLTSSEVPKIDVKIYFSLVLLSIWNAVSV